MKDPVTESEYYDTSSAREEFHYSLYFRGLSDSPTLSSQFRVRALRPKAGKVDNNEL